VLYKKGKKNYFTLYGPVIKHGMQHAGILPLKILQINLNNNIVAEKNNMAASVDN
jgi:hypothetical protein